MSGPASVAAYSHLSTYGRLVNTGTARFPCRDGGCITIVFENGCTNLRHRASDGKVLFDFAVHPESIAEALLSMVEPYVKEQTEAKQPTVSRSVVV